MQYLFIIGGGGFSTEVIDLLERFYFNDRTWEEVYVIDDNLALEEIRGIRNFGTLDALLNAPIDVADVIVTINDCEIRKSIVEKIKASKPAFTFPSVFSKETIILYL